MTEEDVFALEKMFQRSKDKRLLLLSKFSEFIGTQVEEVTDDTNSLEKDLVYKLQKDCKLDYSLAVLHCTKLHLDETLQIWKACKKELANQFGDFTTMKCVVVGDGCTGKKIYSNLFLCVSKSQSFVPNHIVGK